MSAVIRTREGKDRHSGNKKGSQTVYLFFSYLDKKIEFVGLNKKCQELWKGNCFGWKNVSLEDCVDKCVSNEVPSNCNPRRCFYVIYETSTATCEARGARCDIENTEESLVVYRNRNVRK